MAAIGKNSKRGFLFTGVLFWFYTILFPAGWLHSSVSDCLHRRRTKGGVFLFGNRQHGAVGQRQLEAADVAQKMRIDQIALVAAQEQVGILLFQRRDGGHDQGLRNPIEIHTYDCKEILKMKETNPAKKNNSQPP